MTDPHLHTDSDTAIATARSPLLGRSGAVAGEGVDAGVAAHYGDPGRESRMLEEGLAVADLSNYGVVTVTGPDRLSWLHSITSQQLTGLAPRTSASSLVLSPKGHIEHELDLVDDGETTWITVEPGTAPAVAAWLASMQFMLRVEVTDVTSRFAVLGEPIAEESVPGEPIAWVDPWPGPVGKTALYGPDAPKARPARGREALKAKAEAVARGEELPAAVTVPEADALPPEQFDHPGSHRPWRHLIVPREEIESHVGDRPLAGLMAVEAQRIQAWRPRVGKDTDHRTIPHEVDLLRIAVHLDKGCYRGQETVARVHNLGRPPRRLFFGHLDGSGHVLPTPGCDLTVEGRTVGQVTSVGRHHEDGPIALGIVRRNTPVDAILVAGDISVAQTPIVLP